MLLIERDPLAECRGQGFDTGASYPRGKGDHAARSSVDRICHKRRALGREQPGTSAGRGGVGMKNLCTIQHTEAEYLGLMEDHFEGRNIRFSYRRPFTAGGLLPPSPKGFDGLVLLGGGPYGLVSDHLLPSLGHELRLTRDFLAVGLPVIGIELGAVILAVAAGGGATEAPLRFEVGQVHANPEGALAAHLPPVFPMARYLRDRPVLPAGVEILARDSGGEPAIFAVNGNCLGLLGHPGAKRGMYEDLIMEFADTPDDTVGALERLGQEQARIAEALSAMMVGIVAHAGWM